MKFSSTEQLHALFLQTDGITTDTRAIKPNTVFWAIKGASFDGNTFAQQALAQGCSYAVIDNADYYINEKTLLVEDSLKALQALANFHRKQFNIPILGITGSNGKTTTKEIVNAVLSQKYTVFCTAGNFNNEIGVPLTLLGLKPEHNFAIVEMGARFKGDIDFLVNIAEPTCGLITNIGKAHLETMGGLEGVLQTKTELFRYLEGKDSIVFLRYEDDKLTDKSQGLPTFTYGYDMSANVIGTLLTETPTISYQWYTATLPQSPVVNSNLMGEYNFQNILAATAIGVYFEVEPALINKAIEGYMPTNNRSQIVKTANNTLLLDAYNANPTSMEASVLNFANMQGERKVLILGSMKEVGANTLEEHKAIALAALNLGFDKIITLGQEFDIQLNNPSYLNFYLIDDLVEYLKQNPIQNSFILVKGSRSNKLETIVPLL